MSSPELKSGKVSVFSAADLEAIEWAPLHGDGSIEHKVLWHSASGDTIVGVMRLQPGAEALGHNHPAATQHGWILAGSAQIGDREAGPGSYVFVPPGVDPRTAAVGPEPCVLFYIYHPFGPSHDEHREYAHEQ